MGTCPRLRGKVTLRRPLGLASPKRSLATASPPIVPGYQASSTASESSTSSLMSSGRPFISTSTMGCPVAAILFSSSLCTSGILMEVRLAASPLQSQGSPSTITTTLAFRAAYSAWLKPACPSFSTSQPGAKVTLPAISLMPSSRLFTPSTCPAPRHVPRRSSALSARGPITATLVPCFKGRMLLWFLSSTQLSSARVRAASKLASVLVSAASRSALQYLKGSSNSPRRAFTVRTRRTASSRVFLLILPSSTAFFRNSS